MVFIVAAAFAVVIPFFFLGNASGHDFEFHVNSWIEVLSQWRHGTLYPRWASLAHYGYGEARFIFYPPASWVLGAVLGAALPWRLVPIAYIWTALTLSGSAMFFLSRRYMTGREAILAAVLYTASPYYLVIVYWRSAFAELLAGALLPLLLMLVLRMAEGGKLSLRSAVIPLSLVIAVVWLTNLPAAVMVNYSAALLILTTAVLRRSPRILLCGALALTLGALLAAFYILPAVYEEKWVNISQVLSPGVSPQDNFLFTPMADMDHNRFNLVVSMVAAAEIAALAGAAFLLRRRGQQQRLLMWTLTAWGVVVVLLMHRLSIWAWRAAPELRFVQLPFRWLLCLNVAFAMLVPLAWKRWPVRIAVYLTMIAVLAFGWIRVQPPWWETADDIDQIQTDFESGTGYEGVDEYVPLGADAYELNGKAPRVAIEGASGKVDVQRWDAQYKIFTVATNKPSKVVLRLFDYPAWRVKVNGSAFMAEARDITKQLVIPVPRGNSLVEIRFVRTWDRTAGGIITIGTVLLLLIWAGIGKMRMLPETPGTGLKVL